MLCCLIVSGCFLQARAAEPLLLSDETGYVSGPSHVEVLLDDSHELSFDQIQDPETENRFAPPLKKDLNFGLTTSSVWLHFDVKAVQAGTWWGVVHKARIQQVDFVAVYEDGRVEQFRSGMDRPFSERAVAAREHIFPVTLKEGETVRIWIRAWSSASLQLPIKFWDPENYLTYNSKQEAWAGAVMAYLLALVVTGFGFAIMLRERMSAVLAIAIFLNGLTDFCYLGYAELTNLPGKALLSFHAVPFLAHMALVLAMVYVSSLCSVKERWPRFYKYFRAYIGFEFLIALVLLLSPSPFMIALHLRLISLTALLITGISMATVLKRYHPAYYFFGGWVFFLGLVIFRSNAHMGNLSSTWLDMGKFQITCMLGTTLFMLAIADRARLIRKERDETRQRLFEQARDQSELLAQKVQERTAELRAEKERAEEANRKKTWFIANVSHDLRAPISSIIGLSNIFRHHSERLQLPKEFNRFLEQLDSSGEFLMLMLNNVLDLSSFEMNAAQVRPEQIQLREWCGSIANLVQPFATERGVDIRVKQNFLEDRVEADRTRLSQILLNLIHNAIKFSPAKGVVFVDVSLQSDRLRMKIQDQGPGIPEEERDRIFDMFDQGGDGPSDKSGSGLGLSIVQRNTRLLHGTIQLEDAAPSGTVFIVEIPLQSTDFCDSSETSADSNPKDPGR